MILLSEMTQSSNDMHTRVKVGDELSKIADICCS